MSRDIRPKEKRAIGWFMLIASPCFFLVGVYAINHILHFLPGTISTNGTIIRCTTGLHGICDPLVRFRAQTGQQITFLAGWDAAGDYNVGDTIPVRYHPGSPQEARVVNVQTWLGVFTFFGFGLLTLIIGLEGILRR